eukprot:CAMPEP_0201513128 /NCGR_PEP_ID=MMETSP0161_2-20130828/5239_1 /ASSEMBLY_ACC=CAM_ASM_000251 /TAXON_ID=180227 /ORGANISM="Neoparamoeba aestuarina, Strain SoJaBio B1-5/56/2" /LENGTH=150 /DNA_ID=CAMNT_0047909215 /DNA_START=12 /DNA_END=464 /DNA_ORIENTATION=+
MPVYTPIYMTRTFKGPDRFTQNQKIPYGRDLPTKNIEPYVPPGMGDITNTVPSRGFRSTTQRKATVFKPSAGHQVAPYEGAGKVFSQRTPRKNSQKQRSSAPVLPSNVERVKGYAFGRSQTSRYTFVKKSITTNIDYRTPKSFVDLIAER